MESRYILSKIDVFRLMTNKTVQFDNAIFLELENFTLRPHENTTDIIGIGSNDDHYIGTISGIGIKELKKLF